MPRKPRIHYPGALYHVILRGNACQEIFFDPADRYRFYLLLQEGIERFGYRVHAFCLMTNHVHLAIQVGEIPLSRIMQNLAFRYTRWVNRRQDRSGHLFQGRYKAVLVDADDYLLQLVGYLHLNPVRAGIASAPVDYPWSSHRAYLGREVIPWLSTTPVLSQFTGSVHRARKLFDSFVLERAEEGHRGEFHGEGGIDGRVFGEDSFVETALRQAEAIPLKKPTLDDILKAVSDLYGLQETDLKGEGQGIRVSEARGMAAWAVREMSDTTLTALGKRVGRDVTSLSSAVKRLLDRAQRDGDLAGRMENMKKTLVKFTDKPDTSALL